MGKTGQDVENQMVGTVAGPCFTGESYIWFFCGHVHTFSPTNGARFNVPTLTGHCQVPTLAAPPPPPKNNRFLTAEQGQGWSGLQWETRGSPANQRDFYFNLFQVDLTRERLRISSEAEHVATIAGIWMIQRKTWGVKHFVVGRVTYYTTE